MNNFLDASFLVIWRTILSVVVIFILAKITGPRQITQLTFLDYIVGITIGSIAAEMAIDTQIPWYLPIIAMALYTFMTILSAFIADKSIQGRKIFTGIPIILINKGKIIEENLKKYNYDINDLLTQLRVKGYFDLSNIEYAILETTGDISVLPKENYRPTILKDISVPTTQSGLFANVIIDGNIMEANLRNMKKDRKWLDNEVSSRGYKIKDVILMTLDSEDNINIQLKNQKIKDDEDNYFL
ncbi:hypothetical protein ANASTE_00442 [Anaerofustis stercorihominis DSM 17244]|uniref:YetF C-terminal domain-containing protein n=1 Tax=Anaerofustis stercorihominis DSM 17244 TaxID=445971 RepID=B1C6U5_9FIRM|nr:DUF421 domain-containing protein [Anaerofustis stercorihominis]EDS72732.1 hypothetical protein ANASTE_00442 [Anaerofustis stercorihominis DSM 17244]